MLRSDIIKGITHVVDVIKENNLKPLFESFFRPSSDQVNLSPSVVLTTFQRISSAVSSFGQAEHFVIETMDLKELLNVDFWAILANMAVTKDERRSGMELVHQTYV